MNADALSDAVLALVTFSIAARLTRPHPALGTGCLLIGLAAAVGVLRYSGIDAALGPHRFFAIIAAGAGFPLLAIAVRWPHDPIAGHATAAARFAVIAGGVGVAMELAGAGLWRQVVPALAVGLMLLTVLTTPHGPRTSGVLLITLALSCAAAGLTLPVLGLSAAALLHYALAAGLALLALAPPARACVESDS